MSILFAASLSLFSSTAFVSGAAPINVACTVTVFACITDIPTDYSFAGLVFAFPIGAPCGSEPESNDQVGRVYSGQV